MPTLMHPDEPSSPTSRASSKLPLASSRPGSRHPPTAAMTLARTAASRTGRTVAAASASRPPPAAASMTAARTASASRLPPAVASSPRQPATAECRCLGNCLSEAAMREEIDCKGYVPEFSFGYPPSPWPSMSTLMHPGEPSSPTSRASSKPPPASSRPGSRHPPAAAMTPARTAASRTERTAAAAFASRPPPAAASMTAARTASASRLPPAVASSPRQPATAECRCLGNCLSEAAVREEIDCKVRDCVNPQLGEVMEIIAAMKPDVEMVKSFII
ncbi:hypothetical protein MRB53_015534 [Persea americana]|uniref:Uncharacterized protein n=1 Tax=Persea americana TaxID=3435 RepID=A0ACC2LZJ7_PERAE|nr:hypothetical protein MRB53_015534 [Persea americana]